MPQPAIPEPALWVAQQFASAVAKPAGRMAVDWVLGKRGERALRKLLRRARGRCIERQDSADRDDLDALLSDLLDQPAFVEELVLVGVTPVRAVDALAAEAAKHEDARTFPGALPEVLRDLARVVREELRREAREDGSPLAGMAQQSMLDKLLEREFGQDDPDPDDLAERVEARARRQYRSLREDHWLQKGVVEAPLGAPWAELLDAAPQWHELVETEVQGLADTIGPIGDSGAGSTLARFLDDCDELDAREEYPILRSAARELVDRRAAVLAEVDAWKEEQDPGDDRHAGGARRTARHVRQRLDALERLVERPAFARCLLVAGSTGEGKTHFVGRRLLEAEAYPDELIVVVLSEPPADAASVPAAIAAAAQLATGHSWRRWEDLADYADNHSIRLVVAVDDVDLWAEQDPALVRALRREIAHGTRHRSVRWLITAERNGLVRLLAHDWTWLDYAATRQAGPREQLTPTLRPPLDGWVMLDRLNLERRTGAKILAGLVSDRSRFRPLSADAAETLEQLPTPFTAWALKEIADELGEELENLLDLSSVAVIKLLYKRLRRPFEQVPGCDDLFQFDDAMARAAKVLLDQPAGALPYRLLSEAMGVAALGRAMHLGLIGREDGDGLFVRLRLRHPYVWDYLIAALLLDEHGAGAGDMVAALERIVPGQPRARVMQLALQLADDRGATEVWKGALESPSIPDSAVWFAGVRASTHGQAELLRATMELTPSELDREGAYALLRFLEAATAGGQRAPAALNAMRQRYGAIGAHGLAGFVAFTVDEILARAVGADELVACLHALVGSEAAAAAKPLQLALIAAHALRSELPAADASIAASVRFLHAVSAEDTPVRASHDPRTFPEAYARVLARMLIDDYELDAYELLMAGGWYEDGAGGLAERMRSEANVAFGEWFRQERHERRGSYVALVAEQAGLHASQPPRLRSRINALYLTKHSEPLRQGKRSYLDRDFFPIVTVLRRDEELQQDDQTRRELRVVVAMMRASPHYRPRRGVSRE